MGVREEVNANTVETHQTGTRLLIRLAAVAAVWVNLCYLILSVLVTRLLPSESLDPWPLGNVVAAVLALYAPVAVAAWLLVRLGHLCRPPHNSSATSGRRSRSSC